MNESFFGKNGTIQDLIGFSNMYQGSQSGSGVQRLGALGRLVELVMSLFA